MNTPFKETAETIIKSGKAVGDGMSFFQEFLQKKYGFGITFVLLLIAGFATAIWFKSIGVDEGKEISVAEVKSFKEAGRNDSLQIKRLRFDKTDLQRELDSCKKSSTSANLEDLVNKKLDEAERLRKLIERKYTNEKSINTNLKNLLP